MPVKNGNWNGTAKGYYPSGKLRGVVNYVDGKMDGESFEYYESGTVVEERHYANGLRTGTWREFDSDADTVRVGKKTSLFVKLGNADDQKFSKGVMLITSGLKDGMPLDTLAQINGDNRKGFIRLLRLAKIRSMVC